MATNVVVVHNGRRFTIKTTPSVICKNILTEACQRVGISDVDQYGLMHGTSAVDLSLPVRLTNLTSGAKLSLQRRRGGKTVNMALQIVPLNKRLVSIFPTETTLLGVLQSFEADPANQVALTRFPKDLDSGFYQIPVVNIMNREYTEQALSSTSLSSIGLSGNVLARVDFRKSQVDPYTIFGDDVAPAVPELPPAPAPPIEHTSPTSSATASHPMEPENRQPAIREPESNTRTTEQSQDTPTPSTINQFNRTRTVFKAPTQGIPKHATKSSDTNDFEMTVEQAKIYQGMLSHNARVLSDGQGFTTRAQREAAVEAKRAKVQLCEIKFRFPDGTSMITVFRGLETVNDIYGYIRPMLRFSSEPFYLYITPPVKPLRDLKARLSIDLAFGPRTVVFFGWEASATSQATSSAVLSDAELESAVEIQVPDVVPEPEPATSKAAPSPAQDRAASVAQKFKLLTKRPKPKR